MVKQRIRPKFRWVGIVTFVLIVLALVVVPSGSARLYAQGSSVTMRISPATRAIPVNGTATLQVMADLNGQMTNGLGAWEADFVFDPNYLDVTGVTEGSGLGSTGRTTALLGLKPISAGRKAAGQYSYHQTTPLTAGPTGNNIALANVTVKALRAGVTTLDLQNALMTDVQANAWSQAGGGLTISNVSIWNIIDASSRSTDFNGDGVDELGLYVPSKMWYKWKEWTGSGYVTKRVKIGPANGIPVIGDFDGQFGDDLGIYDPVNNWITYKAWNGTRWARHILGFGAVGGIPLF